MRCAEHPNRLATETCGACGQAFCSDCLKVFGEEAYCPDCVGAAARPVPPSESAQHAQRGKLPMVAGISVAALLGAVIVLLAIRPEGADVPGAPEFEAAPPLDERTQRTAACFAALEEAAVAVEIHRAENGVYPTHWGSLIPDPLVRAPIDPWAPSRSTLQLAIPSWDDEAIVLYSVGPDGHDDGGKAYSVETGEGDIVYRVR